MASRITSVLPLGANQFKHPAHDDRERSRGLKRKVSIRDGFLRKLKREGTKILWNLNGTHRRQKPLKKISRSKRKRLQGYYAQTEAFLQREENRSCAVCVRLRERGENILLQPSTEVHHVRGRAGKLLCDERFWAGTCRSHREWPHEHPTLAREMGLLAPAALWNVFPGDGH